MLDTLTELVDRYRNILFVIAAIGIGVIVPNFGPYLEPLILPLVIFLVYSSLRGLNAGTIEIAPYVLLVVLSLCISYVLLPVGGMRIANAFLADDAIVGFAIILSVPTTAGSAIIWTRFSGGDIQLATTISLVSLVVAPIATPVVLTRLVGAQASVPVGSILVDLLVILVGGAVLAAAVPSTAVSARTVDTGATVAILVLIYTSIAGVETSTMAGGVLLTLVAVSLLVLCLGLATAVVCERGFRLDRSRTVPLFFTSSLKNLGVALLIALAYAESLVVVSIITYYVVQQLFGALLADLV